MTISSTTRKAGPFIGNDGTTDFPFTFKVFSTADLYVVKSDSVGAETELILTTDFTVSLNADQDENPGGTLILPVALATGYNLTITSDIAALQPVDLTNAGGFYPTVINTAFDRITMLIQQLAESVSRSIKFSISTPSDEITELPSADRASKAIGFDAFGRLTTLVLSAGTSLVDLAVAAGSSLIGHQPTSGAATTVQLELRAHEADLAALDTDMSVMGIYVTSYGAVGDGTTNDAAACDLADTAAASSGVIYPAGVYYINTNTTLTSPITMMPGARFKVNTGIVLTINAPVYAGSRQYIFECDSAGVVGTFGRVALWADWFGAAPDSTVAAVPGGIDSGIGINKAIVAIKNTDWKHGVVKFNPGVYRIATKIYSATQGMTLIGAGKYQTILTCLAGYTSATGLVHLDGTAGAPINFRGFGVISAVGGTTGSDGINATGNGVFISDVWVSGFTNGIIMDSTDQFLSEFVCEYNSVGVKITSTHCQVERGTTFLNTYAGLVVTGVLISENGRVVVSEVRSNNEPNIGFYVDTSSTVSFENCHVTHTNASQYATGGFVVTGAGNNISLNGCTCYLGTVSTTSIGIKIDTVADVLINDCHVENFKTGLFISTASNASVVGGMFNNNYYRGIDVGDCNFLTIANAQCNYQGTAGAADAGIYVLVNRAFQRLLITGCQCSTGGGGPQDYGIHVTCSHADSHGLVSSNVCAYNFVGNVTIDGANAANIVQANNLVV